MALGKEVTKTGWRRKENRYVGPWERFSRNVPKETLHSLEHDMQLLDPNLGVLLYCRYVIFGWFRFILHRLCINVKRNLVCQFNLPHVRKQKLQPQNRAKRQLLGIIDNCRIRISQLASWVPIWLESIQRWLVDDQRDCKTNWVWISLQINVHQDILNFLHDCRYYFLS